MFAEEYNKNKGFIIEIIGTLLGAAVIAVSVSLFLLPNQLSSGGFTRNSDSGILLIEDSNGIYNNSFKYSIVYYNYF